MAAIRLPTRFNMTNYLSSGITAMVYLDSSTKTVIKHPHQKSEEPALEVERRIHERFQQRGGHEGLLQYHGTFESGIRLEYASKNGLRHYMQNHKINNKQRLQWAQQITSALAFVHSMDVVHADLTCGNISLDDRLHAKLLDFSGSSLDGSKPFVVVTASHKYPGDDLISTQGDLFALGSTLYEILTGKPPYYELRLKEMEITNLYQQSKFPETRCLGPMGDIITGCWQGRFESANDVLKGVPLVKFLELLFTNTVHPSTHDLEHVPSLLLSSRRLSQSESLACSCSLSTNQRGNNKAGKQGSTLV
jgi:serine/threonine protein kinase